MKESDVLKIIDGKPFYYIDYIGYLYNELKNRDEALKGIREKITKHLEAKKYLSDLYTDKQILEFVIEKIDSIEILKDSDTKE